MVKIGIAFSGGGAKTAYQIGVWKALSEYSLDKKINCISGVSMGAFNAVLFIQDDIESAIEMWRNIERKNIAKVSLSNLLKLRCLSDKSSLRSLIDTQINIDKIANSNIEFLLGCTDISVINDTNISIFNRILKLRSHIKSFTLNTNELSKQDLISSLLATCAMPLLFKSETLFEKSLIDGGLLERTPIKVLQNANCTKIIAIHSDYYFKIFIKLFHRNKNVIHIFPKKFQGLIFSGTYNFKKNRTLWRIEQGYNETIKKIDKGEFLDFT